MPVFGMDLRKVASRIAETFEQEMAARTPEQKEIDELFGEFSDFHKEIHGVRPRHIDSNEISLEEMKLELADLYKYYEDNKEELQAEWKSIEEDTSEGMKQDQEQREWDARQKKTEEELKDPYDSYLDDQSW